MGTKRMPEKGQLQFDYYYGNEAEQFSFFRIPKVFLKDKRFSKLSSDAVLLYGVLLDRMQLSIKNCWVDEENRVFIIYRIAEIMEDFGYSNKKSGEMLNELHKFGLIEKVRRGQGKADLIYVKNFIQKQEDLSYLDRERKEIEKKEAEKVQAEPEHFQKCKFYTSENVEDEKSRNVKSTLQEMSNLHFMKCKDYTRNNTDINYNNINNTNINQSIYPSSTLTGIESPTVKEKEEKNGIGSYQELVRQNIEYDALMNQSGISELDKKGIQSLYEIICDVVCRPQKTILNKPYEVVKAQLLRLKATHIKYVLQCLKNSAGKIRNIRNYVLAALLNAEQTMYLYYQQMSNHMKAQAASQETPVDYSEYNFYNKMYVCGMP